MSAGRIYAWAVLIESQAKGSIWKVFKSRGAARIYRKEHGGRLFRIVEGEKD